jgi:uncharacterized Tic20 family protein
MAKKEEIPEPAEKPESETPEPAEKPEGETPAEQETSAEQPGPVQEGPESKVIDKNARMWAMICHLAGLAGIVVPIIGNVVAPLIVWQIKKEEDPFIDEQGKEAVNFQISMSLYMVICIPLCFICIGAFLVPAVALFYLIFLLIAAVNANNGHHYRYPLIIRFIK